MKYSALSIAVAGLLAATQAWAVPVLQIGAPGGPGEGTFANYQVNTSNPTESDTAIISGGSLFVGGVFGPNTLTLGGQSTGADWSSFTGIPSGFDGHDAILLISVPDGTLASALASLTVNGNLAFFSDASDSNFPDNHAPVQSGVSDFLFYDIGDFSNNPNAVPEFAFETGTANGEIKNITVAGFGSLAWAHFDVMALETNRQGRTGIVTSLENNPGSHDVTWKTDGGPPPQELPEPGTLALLGLGLLGIGAARRRNK